MYDSLLLLILMGAGMGLGRLAPRFLKGYKLLQSCAVAVLLFAMGATMRSFTDSAVDWGLWAHGAAIGLAAVAGSVLLAHLYRKCLHKGDPL